MNASEFLRAFPMIKTDQSTGGGCTAWEVPLHADCYVLITEAPPEGDADAHQPSLDHAFASFGICRDCEGVDCRVMSWADAAIWLQGVIDFNETLNTWGAFNINRKGEPS